MSNNSEFLKRIKNKESANIKKFAREVFDEILSKPMPGNIIGFGGSMMLIKNDPKANKEVELKKLAAVIGLDDVKVQTKTSSIVIDFDRIEVTLRPNKMTVAFNVNIK